MSKTAVTCPKSCLIPLVSGGIHKTWERERFATEQTEIDMACRHFKSNRYMTAHAVLPHCSLLTPTRFELKKQREAGEIKQHSGENHWT